MFQGKRLWTGSYIKNTWCAVFDTSTCGIGGTRNQTVDSVVCGLLLDQLSHSCYNKLQTALVSIGLILCVQIKKSLFFGLAAIKAVDRRCDEIPNTIKKDFSQADTVCFVATCCRFFTFYSIFKKPVNLIKFKKLKYHMYIQTLYNNSWNLA